jgi:hypothetical protein
MTGSIVCFKRPKFLFDEFFKIRLNSENNPDFILNFEKMNTHTEKESKNTFLPFLSVIILLSLISFLSIWLCARKPAQKFRYRLLRGGPPDFVPPSRKPENRSAPPPFRGSGRNPHGSDGKPRIVPAGPREAGYRKSIISAAFFKGPFGHGEGGFPAYGAELPDQRPVKSQHADLGIDAVGYKGTPKNTGSPGNTGYQIRRQARGTGFGGGGFFAHPLQTPDQFSGSLLFPFRHGVTHWFSAIRPLFLP